MKSFVSLAIILILLLVPLSSKAATTSTLQKQQQQIEQERLKKEAERKQKEADAAALNALLKRINRTITSTSNALKSTTDQLNQTGADLQQTADALHQSEDKLAGLKDQLEGLIVELYQLEESQSPLLEMFAARNLSEQVAVKQYRETLNQEFDQLIQQEEQTRNEINTAKANLEQKQAELGQLKDQQAATKTGLEAQQKQKDKVLSDTQNAISQLKKDEAELASREKDVEAQIQAALAAARKGGKFVGGLNEAVKQGAVIGYQGNSGNSTGSHLHFTVMKDCDLSQTVNPFNYLGSELAWPLTNYKVTQGYGMTDFAKAGAYHGAIHNGVDLQQNIGAPIHAAADGTIRLSQYFGGYGNAVIIEHANGLCTLYGHMQ